MPRRSNALSNRPATLRTAAVTIAALAGAVAVARAVMTRLPAGITPVEGWDVTRYMGRWYELARLDHRFERGMDNVTATYHLEQNGTVSVVNSGWRNGKQRSANATARFLGKEDVASLAVSFFPGLPGAYHVFALDPDYRWALVTGPNRGYLWLLSRTPQVDDATWGKLIGIARDNGFDTDALIRVRQDADKAGAPALPPKP